MGAQQAPISPMKQPDETVVVRRVEDITPPAGGLPSPPKAPSSPPAHLSPGQRSPVHLRPSRLVLGNTSRGPWRDTVAQQMRPVERLTALTDG